MLPSSVEFPWKFQMEPPVSYGIPAEGTGMGQDQMAETLPKWPENIPYGIQWKGLKSYGIL